MKKIVLFSILFCLISIFVFAQERSVASGGQATGAGGKIDYSIGLVDIKTDSAAGFKITEGVQQPYEIFLLKTEAPFIAGNAAVFPNPTSGTLTLQLNNLDPKKYSYILTDIQGKMLESKKITSDQTGIDLTDRANAAYLLNLVEDGKNVQVYKILKNQ